MTVLGPQLHIIVMVAVALVSVGAVFITRRLAVRAADKVNSNLRSYQSREEPWETGWGLVWATTLIAAPIAVLILIVALVPFQPRYWAIYETSGTVESVSNRFVNASGDLTSGFLVSLDNGQQMVLSDSRVLNLEGKSASFTCSIEWVYQSADRLNCTIRSVAS